MSVSPITSITRAATRGSEPLNILTFPTHERYEEVLCKTGHNFYSYGAEGLRQWNEEVAVVPDNYAILDERLGPNQIPTYANLDCILSQNKFGQFQIAKNVAQWLHLPIISLEHTLPMTNWDEEQLAEARSMRGDLNVFISDYSIDAWGWQKDNDTFVIHHGVDDGLFKPREDIERKPVILSVVNDWINRNWCCGFDIWQQVAKELPTKVVGKTPGLSESAKDVNELVRFYQNSLIFLNTSTVSPVPTALLEAMSCGCAVVSTATCMIPEIIQHGVNGFISNDMDELRETLILLLNNPDIAERVGKEARATILDKFNVDMFVENWNQIFSRASNVLFKG